MPDLRLRMSDRKGEEETTPANSLVLLEPWEDLAQKRSFPALYHMVQHGQLDIPTIGVAKNESGTEVVRTRNMRGLERPTIRGLFIAQRQ